MTEGLPAHPLTRSALDTILGNHSFLIPNKFNKSSSHSSVSMFINKYLDAFVTSVTCTFGNSWLLLSRLAPNFVTIQLSMVPNRNVPRAAAFCTSSEFSNNHLILVAEKYVDIGIPVFLSTICFSFSENRETISAVLASHHTMALCNGFTVSESQATIVSRWFVIPTAMVKAPPTSR